MRGILNIHKPEGPTSFSIVSLVKRLTGIRKVGHAGTLDPAASGVLPLCLGQATRITEYIMESPKTYRAEIEFGKTTDTYDREGAVTSECDASGITEEQIKHALSSFSGEIRQVPPAYSALKYKGKPYYQLARAGIQVEVQSRPVTIYRIEIIGWQSPVATVDVTCSKGTYIRSLAHDIGQELGTGAYMKSLIRLQYGIFTIENALTPEELEAAVEEGTWEQSLFPVDSVLEHIPLVTVKEEITEQIRNGCPITRDIVRSQTALPEGEPAELRFRAYSESGCFLGIFLYIPENDIWKPLKIFIQA